MFQPHIFRAYDIRGIVDKDFDEDGARNIGQAYVTYLIQNDKKEKPKICVGRDGRVSSVRIQKAFIEGAVKAGAQVTDIGLSSSPLLFFSTCFGAFDGGVNITASHNPKEYNGFKLQRKKAHAICGNEIQEILKLCTSQKFEHGSGSIKEKGFSQEYFQKIKDIVHIPHQPKVVIDAGNGATGAFAPQLFRTLGCQVIPLYCEVDGNFPHHDADPEVEENLTDMKRIVQEKQADIGIAFDGDGDRVGFVDSQGKSYASDLILLLLSRDLLSRHRKAKVVIDLKATQILFEEIAKRGGEGIMVQTGHSFVEEKMRKTGALLGGEVSGHLFFGEEYYGFDDAFLAAAKILEILGKSGKTLSQHFANLPKVFTTPEIKVPCPEESKFIVVDRLVQLFMKKYGKNQCLTIDGIRIDFGEGAWGILRASNTSPKIALRFEARTKEKLEEIKTILLGTLLKQPEIDQEQH